MKEISKMTFSDLCNILYPSFKNRCKSKADFFDMLIINSINSSNELLKTEISKLSSKQKRNLFNGISSFSNIARKIYPAIDFTDLLEVIKKEIKGQTLDDLIETLSIYIDNINKNNFYIIIINELKRIILTDSATYRKTQLEGTATLRAELFEENGGICPSCGKTLCLDSGKDNAIVATKLDDFSENNLQSVIGLCRRCAKKFNNGEIDKNLAEIKKKLVTQSTLKKQNGDISFDEKIRVAIENLLKSKNTKKIKLNTNSLKISQKIDKKEYSIFFNKVRTNIVEYFPMIFDLFSTYDGEYRNSYEMLSSTIRIAFLNAEQITTNLEDIFNALVDKVSFSGNCERTIAEIIVCYFVQSCEVFHEISK